MQNVRENIHFFKMRFKYKAAFLSAFILLISFIFSYQHIFNLFNRMQESSSKPNLEFNVAIANCEQENLDEMHTSTQNQSHINSYLDGANMMKFIDNIDCDLYAGRDESQNIAVAILPSGSVTQYAVIGTDGLRFSGEVPFVPNHVRIGERNDGSTVVGFASLRLNSKVFRAPESKEPLQIFQNGHLIFESEKVWDYEIATNGSLFSVHQPMSGNTSRLIVRDIDAGKEQHIDLGSKFSTTSMYSRSHSMNHTKGSSEIMFIPSHADAFGIGTYWFYSVRDGQERSIEITDFNSALLISSSTAYTAKYVIEESERRNSDIWQISKRAISSDGYLSDTIWETELELENFDGRMSISDKGRWLALSSWDFIVVETDSGDEVLNFRQVGDPIGNLNQIISAQRPSNSISQFAKLGDIGFIGDKLYFSWSMGKDECRTSANRPKTEREIRTCYRNLRIGNTFRTYMDVLDLFKLTEDSISSYRTELYPETSCAKMRAGHGLEITDGTVTYRLFSNLASR